MMFESLSVGISITYNQMLSKYFSVPLISVLANGRNGTT